MKKLKRQLLLLLTAAGMTAALSFSVAAASDDDEDEAITSVSLEIDVDVEAGDEETNIDADVDSDEYSVLDVVVSNEPGMGEVWEYKERPKIKITLEAEDGYFFESGFDKGSVSISGSDGTVTAVKRNSKSRLTVSVTMDAIEGGEGELEVNGLEWDKSTGEALWSSTGYAKYYEVQLYGGGRSLTSVLTTTDTRYNFSRSISNSNSYSFRVRAVRSSGYKGEWEESDIWHVSDSDLQGGSNNSTSPNTSPSGAGSGGAWLLDSVGWWYCNPDKSYTVNNWQLIDGRWYFFDASGYMKTGWVDWNGKWYYLGADGAMLANTMTPDGAYVGGDGAKLG